MSITNQVSNQYEIKGIKTFGEELFLNEKWADFHFEFESDDGPCDRIPTHKSILATISDVFRTMFNESWKEKSSVKIVDSSIAEFKEFLQFFYLSRAQLTKENIANVMYLADKYNVQECLRMCEQFMAFLLSADNVCWGYDLAILYNQEFLKRYCETMIAFETKAVFSSNSFLECSKDAMNNILNLNSLSCSALDLFDACMKWLKSVGHPDKLKKEIIQKYLGDTFFKILEGMKIKEFTSLDPSYEQLFTFDEYKTIVKKIASKSTDSEDENQRKRFKATPSTVETVICERLISLSYSAFPYYIKNKETTKFSVNKPLFLSGFSCAEVPVFFDKKYDDSKGKLSARVIIAEILKNSDKEPVIADQIDISAELSTQPDVFECIVQKYLSVCDTHKHIWLSVPICNYCTERTLLSQNIYIQRNEFTHVPLAKAILIKPGFMYAIHMEMSPPENASTGVILKSEVKLDSDIIVQFHGDPTRDDDKDIARGLIYRLNFNQI